MSDRRSNEELLATILANDDLSFSLVPLGRERSEEIADALAELARRLKAAEAALEELNRPDLGRMDMQRIVLAYFRAAEGDTP